MKKVTLIALLLTLFSSISLQAQDENKITFMLLLNEAKQNFKTILGEEFQKSEDGKKECVKRFQVQGALIHVNQ